MVFEKKITLNNPLEEENIEMTNYVLPGPPPPAGVKGVATHVQ